MGKERHKDNALKTYVLKVNMHCCCNGCIKKIKDGVKEIILSEGVDSADLVVEKSEVTVVGTMDPENLCCLFHELTRKDVKIETRRNMSGGGTTPSQETNNRDGPSRLICPRDYRKTAKQPQCLPRNAKRPAATGDMEGPSRAFGAMCIPLVGTFCRCALRVDRI
ncbi:uncharacterized protein LOC100845509 isoform X2 [Brachypodium distachyon]|uniref:uncharacterized protein LOC100845509 isoform X2 n=1 Tax=Brachypodium distachyon TaxID=15368 RepID=UPI00053003F6|nr:uncharacterized protein LOC100845509 isoform X2 [Brachypodium distachyon]|eukprot:XP_024316439.1 uncharacterized protein LOC100845509 isoform X2 [Brachypodium distachyon]